MLPKRNFNVTALAENTIPTRQCTTRNVCSGVVKSCACCIRLIAIRVNYVFRIKLTPMIRWTMLLIFGSMCVLMAKMCVIIQSDLCCVVFFNHAKNASHGKLLCSYFLMYHNEQETYLMKYFQRSIFNYHLQST